MTRKYFKSSSWDICSGRKHIYWIVTFRDQRIIEGFLDFVNSRDKNSEKEIGLCGLLSLDIQLLAAILGKLRISLFSGLICWKIFRKPRQLREIIDWVISFCLLNLSDSKFKGEVKRDFVHYRLTPSLAGTRHYIVD